MIPEQNIKVVYDDDFRKKQAQTFKENFITQSLERAGILKYEEPEKSNPQTIFTRRGQIESFYKQQPFYYDSSKMFWLWDKINFKWILSDEVDFLNAIQQKLGVETIDGKIRTELIEGFKQIGRLHKPMPFKKSWIQFKNKIYDAKTGESFEASHKYFGMNPIPWNLGETEETPTIDKLFSEWVAPEYVKSLYEITAYTLCRDKFMQRIFALCGGGSNGKGTYIKMLYKFIGSENCVSSELSALSEDKFEAFVLFGKLLCIMGEIAHNDLQNTNMVKKLAGEDKLSYQAKGKTPFSEDVSVTIMGLTNSMPITPDKTDGFYRKWFVIDFPNQFKQIKENPVLKIPDVEFENLAKKCLRILKELYENPVFTNEGNFEERAKKYEEHSNPVLRFIESCCYESEGGSIQLRTFTNHCNEFMKQRHLRMLSAVQIGKILRDEGFQVVPRKSDSGESSRVICNLSLIDTKKNYGNYPNYSFPNSFPYVVSNLKMGSSSSSSSNLTKTDTLDTFLKEDEQNLNIKEESKVSKCFFCEKPVNLEQLSDLEGHKACKECLEQYNSNLSPEIKCEAPQECF